jgi:hypothetical protein
MGATSGIFLNVSHTFTDSDEYGRPTMWQACNDVYPIKQCEANPSNERNARIVPGGLNGGGNDPTTLHSKWVAITTDARAMEDTNNAAVRVAPRQ